MSIERIEIAKLELKPGDVLVVRASGAVLSREAAMHAREHFRQYVPDGVKVLVVDAQIDLSVLTRAEIDGRVA